MISEQSLRCYTLRIQNIHQRDGILRKTCSEYNDFKILANFDDEFATIRPDLHVDVASATFDIDWQHNICLVCRRERRMDKGLIDIKNKRLSASQGLSLWLQEIVPIRR